MANYEQRGGNRSSIGSFRGNTPHERSDRKQNGDTPQQPEKTPEAVLTEAGFNPGWITSGADAALPDFADKIGWYMAENKLTKSKIRSVYGEIKRIQMGGFEREKASFYLLRPKVAYAQGRDKDNKGLRMFKLVFDKSAVLVQDSTTYHHFCNLIEAILAYHKAYGGKD